MESLSSFTHAMRATAMQPGQLSYLPKRSSIGRITLAAIVLGGIIIATAGWYTLKNRKVRLQQPPPVKPIVEPEKTNFRPIKLSPFTTEKIETLQKASERTDPPLFLFSAAKELKDALDGLKEEKEAAMYGASKVVAQGYFERLELLEDYYKNGFLCSPVPYDSNTGKIHLKDPVKKVVKEDHRNTAHEIFRAVDSARTDRYVNYIPAEKELTEGLLFLLREDIYEAPPSQQSDAQRLADLVWPPNRPLTKEVQQLARTLLESCPEKINSSWNDPEHISQDGVKLYDYCGRVEDVRLALTRIAQGERLNSDRQADYIRGFDRLMIELQTTAAKVRKEKEKCQEVGKKLNNFLDKWREDLSSKAKNDLNDIIKDFEAGRTLKQWQEGGKKLNNFLDKSPNNPYFLKNKAAINELNEIMKDFQTAPEASGAG